MSKKTKRETMSIILKIKGMRNQVEAYGETEKVIYMKELRMAAG